MSTPDPPFRIEVKSDSAAGPVDWSRAYQELAGDVSPVDETPIPVSSEVPRPTPPAPPAKPRPVVTANAATPLPVSPHAATPLPIASRYEELCRAPSMGMEKADINVMTHFSQVIAAANDAARSIEMLEKNYPGQLPERMVRLWRDNLRETVTIMMRELQAMRNGRQQKKYDKKNVCCVCHSVFMVPLPSDGKCDACRASEVPRGGGAY